MTYYLLKKGDKRTAMVIGEVSFQKFYPSDGFDVLTQKLLGDISAEAIELIDIVDDMGKSYRITEFLDSISKLRMQAR